ncbi:hypothetical protein JKG47_15745 [Acidithiobacillus sp. MC6.1]|nr:hypothetical protein [Acidithiobacillus sp. MC6.1]
MPATNDRSWPVTAHSNGPPFGESSSPSLKPYLFAKQNHRPELMMAHRVHMEAELMVVHRDVPAEGHQPVHWVGAGSLGHSAVVHPEDQIVDLDHLDRVFLGEVLAAAQIGDRLADQSPAVLLALEAVPRQALFGPVDHQSLDRAAAVQDGDRNPVHPDETFQEVRVVRAVALRAVAVVEAVPRYNQSNSRVGAEVALQEAVVVGVVPPPAWGAVVLDSIDSTIAGNNTTSCTAHRAADYNNRYRLREAENTHTAVAIRCCPN